MKGKCKSNKHSSTGGAEDSAVPAVGFDYAFLSDGEAKSSSEDDDAEVASSSVMKVLIRKLAPPFRRLKAGLTKKSGQ